MTSIQNKDTHNQFVHTHLHTYYSLLDGASSPSELAKKAKDLGMTALAITDHNHIGGWLDFKDACDEHGIKPIFGCEMYMTRDSSIISMSADERREIAMAKALEDGVVIPDKIEHVNNKGKIVKKKTTKTYINELIAPYNYDVKQYHLIVLALNQTGANNLIKLQSEAADVGLYNGRFCCDLTLLEKYNEGLIITSACLSGFIPNLILQDKEDEARWFISEFKRIFGDRFYLEIQPLFNEDQEIVNFKLAELSEEFEVELIAANDVHYANKEDFDDHDSLVCVGTGRFKQDEDRMHYKHEFWIRSYDEMKEAFERHTNLDSKYINRALANTLVIADRVSNDIKLGSDVPLFPKINVPEGMTPETYLIGRSYNRLYKYLNKRKEAGENLDRALYEKRLKGELDIINFKGFAPYFLSIFEIIDYCEENDIPTGPGRGSAAGSLTLFVNGGTRVVDPIKYDLLFFRFLTADRKDLPD